MFSLLSMLAVAAPCNSTRDAERSYKPKTGSFPEEGAGWPKDLLRSQPESTVKLWKSYRSAVKRYPRGLQEQLVRGVVETPVDEVGVALAWGSPDYLWKSAPGCRALLYGERHDTLFESCGGNIVRQYDLEAPLDCERLDSVVPRIEKKKGRFTKYSVEQQFDILGGFPSTWMTEGDLDLAFGDAYKKRDRGSVLLYHDDSGVREGPVVSLDAEGYLESVTWPVVAELTKKGKRSLRRTEREQARRAQLESIRRERAAARRRLLSAVAVAVVAAGIEEAANQQAAKSSPSGGTTPPNRAPSSRPSTSRQVGTATEGGMEVTRDTTTTTGRQGGIDVTETRTNESRRPAFASSYRLFTSCGIASTLSLDINVTGDRYTARGTHASTSIVETAFESPVRYSGAITRQGEHDFEMVGLGKGKVYVSSAQLFLGMSAPVECIGKQMVNRSR